MQYDKQHHGISAALTLKLNFRFDCCLPCTLSEDVALKIRAGDKKNYLAEDVQTRDGGSYPHTLQITPYVYACSLSFAYKPVVTGNFFDFSSRNHSPDLIFTSL